MPSIWSVRYARDPSQSCHNSNPLPLSAQIHNYFSFTESISQAAILNFNKAFKMLSGIFNGIYLAFGWFDITIFDTLYTL